MKTKKILLILALLCAVVQGAWADSSLTTDGSGNYTIGNETDWATFCSDVNNGTENYSGKYVQLIANISVSEMVGTSSHMFQGTFLGDGVHTLTFTKGSSGSAFNEEYCAPFRYTNGATITNLKVTGDIYTAQKFGAGLIARPNGTTTITNCHVSTVIHSSVSGDGTHSGYIAYPQGNVNFSGCVYDGHLFTTNGTTHCGGFVGWHNSKTFTFTNSLYAPNPSITPAANEVAITTDCATFVRGGSAGTGCYYTETMGEAQGTPPYTSAPAGEISTSITVNNTAYYMPCTVSGVNSKYMYTISVITVTPTVTFNGTPLAEGTDYTYAITPATVQEVGDYTLTITGTGSYQGTKTIEFTVVDYLVKGKFTINASGDMVKFASGNLQATTTDLGANWTWGFASHQWDRIGNNTPNNKVNGAGTVSQNGTIDLFSWVGASSGFTGAAQYGITMTGAGDTSQMGFSDSESLKSEWGTLFGGAYRTLTADEWDYVFNVRESGATVLGTQNARYTHAVVNGVKGVILFPDEVNIALSEADAWGKINAPSAWKTECNAAQWAALEAKGCVFLPVTGLRYSYYQNTTKTTFVDYVDEGYYWSSSPKAGDKESAYYMLFKSNQLEKTSEWRVYGMSVRLVRDYVTPHVDSYAIADGDTYTATEDFTATSATYTKTTDRVGKFHSWLVPFDHTITAADAEKFTFYKINMIANAPNPQTNASDEMWVFLKQIGEGDMLHANMPYVYKPKAAVTDYAFTTNNAVLKAKADDVRITMMTAEDTYTIYATYAPTTATVQDPFYYVNIDGGISLGNDGTVSVGAFRWIIRVESKFGGSTAYARKMTFFDGEEATGVNEVIEVKEVNDDSWYTLDGRRLSQKPSRAGVYINNGIKRVIK